MKGEMGRPGERAQSGVDGREGEPGREGNIIIMFLVLDQWSDKFFSPQNHTFMLRATITVYITVFVLPYLP